jgi:DNA-directed RNA polymerase specialized sigma24 family protein
MLLLSPVIDRLVEIDPRAASVLDLRFFLGCSLEETADVLGVTVRAVRDDWDFARVWLRQQLQC